MKKIFGTLEHGTETGVRETTIGDFLKVLIFNSSEICKTSSELISTSSELISTSAELISTNAELISTNAEKI
jgi:hypothetical protein